MKKDKKQGNLFSTIFGILLLIFFAFMRGLLSDEGKWIVVCLVIIVSLFSLIFKKGAAGKEKTTTRPAPVQRHAPRPAAHAHTESEEAVRCAHSRGKEKYLEQLDTFLANGIIDRAEYKLMHERYEKLDIPDDFH